MRKLCNCLVGVLLRGVLKANCNCHLSLHNTNLSTAVCKEEFWGDDGVE